MKLKILSSILVLIIIISTIIISYAQDEEIIADEGQEVVLIPIQESGEEEIPEEPVEVRKYTISDEELSKMHYLERLKYKVDPNEMDIYSESCVLIEEKTGKVLFEKGMHDRKYPASITKILTAILTIENCDLNEKAVVSQNAVDSLKSGYTKANVQVGEEFTVEELLEVMMLQSANEVSVVLAEHVSGSVEEFSKLMNKKAQELGCFDSNFVNPNGMHDENHYSSAYDFAMIGRYAMQNKDFRRIITTSSVELPHSELWTEEKDEELAPRKFYNRIQLMNPDSVYYYPYTIGIKAGFTTPAKNCFVGAANKDGRGLITCVMHAELADFNLGARYCDTINLFEYGFNNFDIEKVNYEVENKNIIAAPETEDSSTPEDGYIDDEVKVVSIPKLNPKTKEIIKIVIGALLLIGVILYFVISKLTKGKRELTSNLYKIQLPKGRGKREK